MNINRNVSHASAFISSTFLDLKEERKAVAKVLKEANFNINALDIKPASNNKSKEEILKGINESDFLILIVGQRYGAIIPEMTTSDKLSITKWEYRQAKYHYRKDILVFFKESDADNLIDYGTESNSKLKLLDEFKIQLTEKHNPKYFSTISELEEEIKKALIPTYRSGVASLLSKLEQLKKDNTQLRRENEKLNNVSLTPISGGIFNPNNNGLSKVKLNNLSEIHLPVASKQNNSFPQLGAGINKPPCSPFVHSK